jgi:hypothetical protein
MSRRDSITSRRCRAELAERHGQPGAFLDPALGQEEPDQRPLGLGALDPPEDPRRPPAESAVFVPGLRLCDHLLGAEVAQRVRRPFTGEEEVGVRGGGDVEERLQRLRLAHL